MSYILIYPNINKKIFQIKVKRTPKLRYGQRMSANPDLRMNNL